MKIDLKQMEIMYPWLKFEKNALDYSWDELVRDQLILIEASIRRNFFNASDQMSLLMQYPFIFLKIDKYKNKDVWLTLIEMLSKSEFKNLEEEISASYIQEMMEWIIQNKTVKIYDLLRYFDADISKKIFRNDKLSKTIINSIVKNTCKIIDNEYAKAVKVFINDANTALKYAPVARKIVKKSDWKSIFKQAEKISTDTMTDNRKNSSKDSELKTLSEFLKSIAKLEVSFDKLRDSYIKAIVEISTLTRGKIQEAFSKVQIKFYKYYDDSYMAMFCALTQAVFQDVLGSEVSITQDFVANDSFLKHKVMQQCKFVLDSNMTECLKRPYEATLKILEKNRSSRLF